MQCIAGSFGNNGKKKGPMEASKKPKQGGVPTRTLYYFRIIHTPADMGGLREKAMQSTLKALGLAAWNRKMKAVDSIWTQIERFIESLRIPYASVRVYQDGLPICGREIDIVRELADNGSRNHRLLLRLLEKGATVMGTESPELLVEEYELAQDLLCEGTDLREGDNPQKLGEELLKKRDQFIAQRINQTLRPEETGILFLGMLHSPEKLLDKDIRVIPIPHTFSSPQGVEDEGDRQPHSDC
jgi:hypothetical protein